MKQFVSWLCCFALLLVFCSCGEEVFNRSYDEEEVLQAAESLILKSALLNEIYYGTGIPPSEAEDAFSSGFYREADPGFLAEHGISVLEDIKTMTKAVFSEEQARLMINGKLHQVVDDEDNIIAYARYYQSTKEEKDPESGETVTVSNKIIVNTDPSFVLVGGAVEYDISTLRVVGAEGEHVIVSLSVIVEDEDGAAHTVVRRIRLLEEQDGWRLDSPTYVKYSSETDRYYDHIQ